MNKIRHSHVRGKFLKEIEKVYTWDEWLAYLPPCHLGFCPCEKDNDENKHCRTCITNLGGWIIKAKEKLKYHNRVARSLRRRGKR